jgi:hypothetical protein
MLKNVCCDASFNMPIVLHSAVSRPTNSAIYDIRIAAQLHHDLPYYLVLAHYGIVKPGHYCPH